VDKSIVDKFVAQHSGAETPNSYFRWSMYATIAAILRNHCLIETNDERIYPNVYVIIVSGKSSITRKSIPMREVGKFLHGVSNTKIIQGRGSMEGYFDRLATDGSTDNGQMLAGAQGILFGEELSALIYQDASTLHILTSFSTNKSLYSSERNTIFFICSLTSRNGIWNSILLYSD